jgi:hypothetical protein
MEISDELREALKPFKERTAVKVQEEPELTELARYLEEGMDSSRRRKGVGEPDFSANLEPRKGVLAQPPGRSGFHARTAEDNPEETAFTIGEITDPTDSIETLK